MKNQAASLREAFPPLLFEKLTFFSEELIAWNRKFSFTSVPDGEIFVRLIAPSAWLGQQYAKEKIGSVVDFGSGPGIPGVPMALADPDNRYTIIDSNEKKIGFIKHLLTVGGLFDDDNIDYRMLRVTPGRWEDRADRVVTRSAGSLLTATRLWDGKIKPGSAIDFFKGTEIGGEIEDLKKEYPAAEYEELKTPDWFHHLKVIRVTVNIG